MPKSILKFSLAADKQQVPKKVTFSEDAILVNCVSKTVECEPKKTYFQWEEQRRIDVEEFKELFSETTPEALTLLQNTKANGQVVKEQFKVTSRFDKKRVSDEQVEKVLQEEGIPYVNNEFVEPYGVNDPTTREIKIRFQESLSREYAPSGNGVILNTYTEPAENWQKQRSLENIYDATRLDKNDFKQALRERSNSLSGVSFKTYPDLMKPVTDLNLQQKIKF